MGKNIDFNAFEVNANDYLNKKSSGLYTVSGDVIVATVSDENFYKSDKIVSVNNLIASAEVTQPNPHNPFKCNFSFNFNIGIKIQLPDLNAPSPNFDLLFKIDTFSEEVSLINDNLIMAIQRMNCCDLESAYNHTIVPFFRWFADHKDAKNCKPEDPLEEGDCGPMFGGNTFPTILYSIAKILVEVYIVVRPLVCLIRPIPGNPWFPFDFDQLFLIKFLTSFFDLYYDIIVSGKIMNYPINIVKNIRRTLQICLFGGEGIKAAELNVSAKYYDQILKDITVIKNKRKLINIKRKLNQKKLNSILTVPIIVYSKILGSNNINFSEMGNDFLVKNYLRYGDPDSSSLTITMNEILNIMKKNKMMNFKYALLQVLHDKFETLPSEIWIAYGVGDYSFGISNNDQNRYLYLYTNKNMVNSHSKNNSFSNPIKISDLNNDLDPLIDILNKRGVNEANLEKAKNLQNKIVNQNKKINSYDKALDQLNTELSLQDKTLNSGQFQSLASETYLTKASIVKMSNNNSLCDCVITSLETLLNKQFRIPLPENLTDISESGFSGIKGKEAWRITFNKIEDKVGVDIAKTLYYSSYNYTTTFNQNNRYENNKNEGLVFSKDIINGILAGYEQLDKRTLNNLSTPSDLLSSLDLLSNSTALDNGASESLSNNSTFTGAAQYSKFTNRYLKGFVAGLDAVNEKDLHILPKFKKEVDEETGMTLFKVTGDFFPTNIYPSNYILLQKKLQTAYKESQGHVFQYQHSLDSIQTVDYNKWSDAGRAVNQQIQHINTQINKTKISNFQQRLNLQDDLNTLKQIRSVYFLSYPGLDFFQDDFNDKYNRISNYTDSLHDSNITGKLNIFKNNHLELKSKTEIQNYYQWKSFRDTLGEYLISMNIGEIFVWKRLEIPCTCDGLICKLIQMIINFLLSMLNQLIQEIVNMIMEWFWKSWLGKLIKFIISKIKCFMELININHDLHQLNTLVDNLTKELKGRIKLYTDPTVCLRNALNNNDNPFFTDENGNPIASDNSNGANGAQQITSEILHPHNSANPNIQKVTPTEITKPEGGGAIVVSGGKPDQPDDDQHPGSKPGSIQKLLPATLIITPSVTTGPTVQYPNHTFPLLNFDCNCNTLVATNDTDKCDKCTIEIKNNTLTFFNETTQNYLNEPRN